MEESIGDLIELRCADKGFCLVEIFIALIVDLVWIVLGGQIQKRPQ